MVERLNCISGNSVSDVKPENENVSESEGKGIPHTGALRFSNQNLLKQLNKLSKKRNISKKVQLNLELKD